MAWTDYYDAVRVVSLADRYDRRRDVRAELIRLGAIRPCDNMDDPTARIAFFDAIRRSDAGLFRNAGSHGCYLSHLALFERAAILGQSLLILQDDCDFTAAAFELRHPPRCDIFYGGFELVGEPADPEQCEVIGAHCMGFSRAAVVQAAVYLRALLDPRAPADPVAAGAASFDAARRPPIDGALVWFRRAHPGLVTVFKKVSEQRSSRTDIGHQHAMDRWPVARSAASAMRRVRRRLRRMIVPSAVASAVQALQFFSLAVEPAAQALYLSPV